MTEMSDFVTFLQGAGADFFSEEAMDAFSMKPGRLYYFFSEGDRGRAVFSVIVDDGMHLYTWERDELGPGTFVKHEEYTSEVSLDSEAESIAHGLKAVFG